MHIKENTVSKFIRPILPLIDYFGTVMGMFSISVIDVSNVERASESELIKIAKQNGYDLIKYEKYRR